MRKQPTGVTGVVDSKRRGDPKLGHKLPPLRPNIERTSHTTDGGCAGVTDYPSMYDLARSLTGGKWGSGGKWK